MDLSGTCSDILTELRWGEDMAGGLLLGGAHRCEAGNRAKLIHTCPLCWVETLTPHHLSLVLFWVFSFRGVCCWESANLRLVPKAGTMEKYNHLCPRPICWGWGDWVQG